jgi:hypothetical protein
MSSSDVGYCNAMWHRGHGERWERCSDVVLVLALVTGGRANLCEDDGGMGPIAQ